MGCVSAKTVRRWSGEGSVGAFGGTIGDDGPGSGSGDGQLEAGLDVRLIEAGKGHAGVHGDEERVDVFAVVVAILEAGDGGAGVGDRRGELDAHFIFAAIQAGGEQFEMAFFEDDRRAGSVDLHGFDAAPAKIEEKRDTGG